MNTSSIQTEETDEESGAKSGGPGGLFVLARYTLKQIRRLVVLVTGMTVLLIGVIMFVTPGPALVVIPAGLGILAIEFAWARRLLAKAKTQVAKSLNGISAQRSKREEKTSDE